MDLYTIFLILCMATLGSSIGPHLFNVVDFGAVGDGITDDSKAFMKAWGAVCKATHETLLIVPPRKTFLLKPVKFLGPCKSPSIQILVEGNIVAPSKISAWTTTYMGSWIVFVRVNGVKVIGNGEIHGKGFEWWRCAVKSKCMRPMGMKFHSCNNIEISGLKIFNTPEKFLSVSDSNHVIISNLQIKNPKTSPNTDGMDLTHSTNVYVRDSHISTGDDCIAILSGCSRIFISGISCIQGHGISIGSMGHNGQYDTVEEVHVRNCKFGSSLNGAHIKTWQGGSGFVRKVTFQDITLHNTSNPINIDQFYCPGGKCPNQTRAVQLSDISFIGFRGTSFTETAINIACSQSLGCSNIFLDHINIISSDPYKKVHSNCFNAHGRSINTFPAVKCLQ